MVRLIEDDLAQRDVFDEYLETDVKQQLSASFIDDKKQRDAEEKAAIALLAKCGTVVQYVQGNMCSLVQRLCDEYKKAMQAADSHTDDYVSRLKDETQLLEAVSHAQMYYERLDKREYLVEIMLQRLHLLHYQLDPQLDALGEKSGESKAGIRDVPALAKYLYAHGDQLTKLRALLLHIYHLALHNQLNEAHDLLLMSHAQDQIHDTDVPTRILYNRAMAQLGLCAFRVGDTRQAHMSLQELFQSGRPKELIAQSISLQRQQERDEKQERMERARLVPFHMHINADMLEAVYLVCAMLLEVPNMAAHGVNNKRKILSKQFRKYYDFNTRQAFNGPPENTRDLVMAASKSMQTGDWKRAVDFVNRLRMWTFMPHVESARANLTRRIQEETLRTYVLTYGPQYSSMLLSNLCDMFQLPPHVAHKILSKMMVNEELLGAWDQLSGAIIMHSQEPSRLQRAANLYADKLQQLFETNEKLLEMHGIRVMNSRPSVA